MSAKTTKTTTSSEEKLNEELKAELKECFIITPIGSIASETFNKTEGLIKSVLEPILNDFGFKAVPAHHINDAGSINKQIINRLVNCELAIANLTEVNPNVMYELAIRHSFGKKVIILAEHGTKLPFDINDQRTIFYYDTMLGVEVVKPQLRKMIEVCLAATDQEENISNPIYDSVKQIAAIKQLPAEQQDVLSIIMSKLDSLDINNKYSPKNELSASSGLWKQYNITGKLSGSNAELIPRVKLTIAQHNGTILTSDIKYGSSDSGNGDVLKFTVAAIDESTLSKLISSLMKQNIFNRITTDQKGELYIV